MSILQVVLTAQVDNAHEETKLCESEPRYYNSLGFQYNPSALSK